MAAGPALGASRRLIRTLASGSLAVLLLAGCATAPPPPRVPGAAAAWLGGTPRVVVRLDAARVAAWAQVTGKQESLKAVGQRTKTVWLGFDLAGLDDLKTAAGSVRIVLEGDFPRGAAGLMLDWNASWKKGPGKGVWTNPKMGLSVTLPAEDLVTVRRNDPTVAAEAPGILRDLDPAAVERPAVWISFWDPGEALFGAVGAKLLPVERLDVALEPREGFLEGPLVLRFADERAARAASVLLKLLGPQVRARLGQDLEWALDGTRLVGSTLRLKQDDLQALAQKLVADPPAPESAP